VSKLYSILRWVYNNAAFGVARLRALFWGLFFKKLGKGSTIMRDFVVRGPHGISIGDFVNINYRCTLDGNGGLDIGDYVMIGQNVTILTTTHRFDRTDVLIRGQGDIHLPIKIEDNVWIGANVVILPGVTVGTGSVLAAAAVVTKSVPPYAIVAGVPAKVVRFRKEPAGPKVGAAGRPGEGSSDGLD